MCIFARQEVCKSTPWQLLIVANVLAVRFSSNLGVFCLKVLSFAFCQAEREESDVVDLGQARADAQVRFVQ